MKKGISIILLVACLGFISCEKNETPKTTEVAKTEMKTEAVTDSTMMDSTKVEGMATEMKDSEAKSE